MDAQTRRAIEPFFSTKGIGKGTGLGLSMAHGLAAQLGGALIIHSAPGEGTSICILLPQGAHVRPVPPPRLAVAAKVTAGGRVLLVDDDELVRTSTGQMLVDLGYQVTVAASAEQAIQLFRRVARPTWSSPIN